MSKREKYSSKTLDSILNEMDSMETEKVNKLMLLAMKIDMGREEMGWNNLEMAEKFNQRPSVITKWLSGTHNFTLSTLMEIEYIMGIKLINLDISDLLGVIQMYEVGRVPNYSVKEQSNKWKSFYYSSPENLKNAL